VNASEKFLTERVAMNLPCFLSVVGFGVLRVPGDRAKAPGDGFKIPQYPINKKGV
jgi:hypothetical protein